MSSHGCSTIAVVDGVRLSLICNWFFLEIFDAVEAQALVNLAPTGNVILQSA
jgi:hypothetical protein